jgi:hypothetical protein
MSALMDELIETTRKNRADLMAIQVLNETSLSFALYGPRRSYTRRERLVRRVHGYLQRVSDAWLVLTGKAYVGDDY